MHQRSNILQNQLGLKSKRAACQSQQMEKQNMLITIRGVFCKNTWNALLFTVPQRWTNWVRVCACVLRVFGACTPKHTAINPPTLITTIKAPKQRSQLGLRIWCESVAFVSQFCCILVTSKSCSCHNYAIISMPRLYQLCHGSEQIANSDNTAGRLRMVRVLCSHCKWWQNCLAMLQGSASDDSLAWQWSKVLQVARSINIICSKVCKRWQHFLTMSSRFANCYNICTRTVNKVQQADQCRCEGGRRMRKT